MVLLYRCKWTGSTRTGQRLSLTELEQARAEQRRARARRHANAAEKARELWGKSRPADPHHPYLVAKGITPCGARQRGQTLFLPVCSLDGTLWSLQMIQPDGSKQLLKGGAKRGHSIPVAGKPDAESVIICEGLATGCTLAAHYPGALILAAVDADNLTPVALSVRERCPGVAITIAGDDDRLTIGNPGATAAEAAARSAGARLILPAWPDDAPETLSDFNDLDAWMRKGVRDVA